MGQALFPTNSSRKFDQLFLPETDVALYAHVHHQLLRYGSDERIILNPGSVGNPLMGRQNYKLIPAPSTSFYKSMSRAWRA